MNRIHLCFFSLLAHLTVTGPAHSGDIFCYDPELNCKKTKRSSVWAGFGQLKARAREIVYGGPGGHHGDELSHLIWDTDNALTFNLGFTGEINDRWNLFFDGSISLGPDNSQMVNYDWIYDDPQLPYYNYPDKTQWTDRSQHPDTNLIHYYQIDTGLDFYAIEQQKLDLILRFGFRYTDIGFDAYNGLYVYSDQVNGFRGDIGNWTDGLGISYRQKLPGFYLNPRINWKIGQAVDLTL